MSEEWRTWKFPGIYAIKHVVDGKVYVGQSVNMSQRILHHKCSDRDCVQFYRALARDGWDAFEVIALEKVDDRALLNEREQYWIDTLDSHNPEKGYNTRRTAIGKTSSPKPKKSVDAFVKVYMPKQLLTLSQVGEIFNVHPKTIKRWGDAGMLTLTVLKGRYRVEPSEVEKLRVNSRRLSKLILESA